MKNQTDIKKCPYCKFSFKPTSDDVDMIDKIETYWCPHCGEQYVEELDLKNNKNHNNRKEWN